MTILSIVLLIVTALCALLAFGFVKCQNMQFQQRQGKSATLDALNRIHTNREMRDEPPVFNSHSQGMFNRPPKTSQPFLQGKIRPPSSTSRSPSVKPMGSTTTTTSKVTITSSTEQSAASETTPASPPYKIVNSHQAEESDEDYRNSDGEPYMPMPMPPMVIFPESDCPDNFVRDPIGRCREVIHGR
jgi:hypothetical protein